MDEPCSALDPVATNKIEQLMEGLSKLVTIIIVHPQHASSCPRCRRDGRFFTSDSWWKWGRPARSSQPRYNRQTEDYVSGRFG